MRRAVERFSWLMYEIVLKYACPVSDIIFCGGLSIQLSEHFTYRKLLRFTLPSVIMMVCTSIYGVVDGVFVSNFVGSDAFAAVNLIMPFLMVLGAVGFMLGTGGSALAAYTLGAGNEKRANEIFSLLIYVLIGLGAVFTIGGIAFLTPMARLLGADELRTYRPAGPDPLYAAKHLPELSGDGGTASAGSVRHHCRRRHQHRAGHSVRGVFVMGHPPRSKKGHGRHSLSCPFLCLLTARSRQPWGCRQPETRRCRCAWW